MTKSSPSALLAGWKIQRRVIFALLMREVLTRYGRHNIGFLWLFVEPMIFTLGVAALWTFTQNLHGSSLPIVAFAVTGYSSVLLWRNMPSRCIGAIMPNLPLLYHRHVKIMDIFVSRVLLEMVGATASFVILSITFVGIGWMAPPTDPLLVLRGWIMLAWFGSSLAMLLGALAQVTETVDKIWHPASYLLFPLSGAAFLVDALPKVGQDVVLFLPMVHGVEMVREGYFGQHFVPHYDFGFMFVVNLVLSLAALLQIRAVSDKVVPE